MNWFYIALLSTVCFSAISHIDKYLISKYLRGDGIGALMLFSSLFAIVILPVILIIRKGVVTLPIFHILFLIIVGILSFIAILFYFKALTYADASTIIPFFQLIPVFGFILGIIILGETIPAKSIVAGLIILFGTFLISLKKRAGEPVKVNGKIIFLMIGSSFTYAFYEVLFKVVTIPSSFMVSFFWQNVGLLLAGLFMYLFISRYRKEFHNLIQKNGINILSLNFVNEILNTVGVSMVQYATLLVPIALVMLVNSLQPAIVFLSGFILTTLVPNISRENTSKVVVIQKSLAIIIIFIGTYLLYT